MAAGKGSPDRQRRHGRPEPATDRIPSSGRARTAQAAAVARGGSAGARAGSAEDRTPARPPRPARTNQRQASQQPAGRADGEPSVPDDVDVSVLGEDVRAELRGLSSENAERVGRHLVAAGRLLEEDPRRALDHARAARRTAGRLPAVREAVGLAAYLSGEWQEALTELRAVRRMTGDSTHLPLLADCERGLGRPDRALVLARSPEAARLGTAERVELRIVEAGARRDLGQVEAALVVLQDAGVDSQQVEEWTIRLWYAYADTLLAAGRGDEARRWFRSVEGADVDELTDAGDRLAALDG